MRAYAIAPSHLALAMLVWSSCGYFGIDLREGTLDEGGVDDGGDRDASAVDAAWQSMDAMTVRRPCDFAGTWGARISGALRWPAGLVTAGNGTVNMWLRYESTAGGAIVAGSLALCGMAVPDFKIQPLLGEESYHVMFPNPLFDALPARVLATDTTLSIEGPGRVGDAFSIAPAAIVVGAQLADPVNGAWPAASTLTPVDIDADGQPGMTIDFQSDAGYSLPRVSAFSAQRAQHAGLALRAVLQAEGTFASCSEASGPALLSKYDTHIVGCSIEGGGACSSMQRDLLDANLPLYSVGTATYRAIKVPDNSSCGMVRDRLLPQ